MNEDEKAKVLKFQDDLTDLCNKHLGEGVDAHAIMTILLIQAAALPQEPMVFGIGVAAVIGRGMLTHEDLIAGLHYQSQGMGDQMAAPKDPSEFN